MQRLDGKRDIDLLNKYYKLSLDGEVQALKAHVDFKKRLFADNEADELAGILAGVQLPAKESNDEDFEMEMEIE